MDRHAVQHAAPQVGDVVIDHRGRYQPGVDHLEDILVLESLIGRLNHDQLLARMLQGVIDPAHRLEVAARLPDEQFPARQVAQRLDRRARGTGDQHFVDPGTKRGAEIDLPQSFLGDTEVGGRDITPPRDQRRQKFVPHDRHEDDVDRLAARLRVLLVELRLERLEAIGGDAADLPAVNEEIGATQRDEHTNAASRDHLVEVAGPLPRSALPRKRGGRFKGRIHRGAGVGRRTVGQSCLRNRCRAIERRIGGHHLGTLLTATGAQQAQQQAGRATGTHSSDAPRTARDALEAPDEPGAQPQGAAGAREWPRCSSSVPPAALAGATGSRD